MVFAISAALIGYFVSARPCIDLTLYSEAMCKERK